MKAESIRFKKRAQVTIPKEFVDQLNLLEGYPKCFRKNVA